MKEEVLLIELWPDRLAEITRAVEKAGLDYRIVRPHAGGRLEREPYRGIIISGGAPNVTETDKYPFLRNTISFVGGAVREGTPVLGICLVRHFKDDDTIYIEPFRARAFPVLRDLIVDRGAFEKIIQSGGYISVHTGGVPDGNAILIPKPDADRAMDAAECIGCGPALLPAPMVLPCFLQGQKYHT